MLDPATCLAHAEQAETLAALARNPETRRTFEEIADRWRKMAADPAFQKAAARFARRGN